MSTIVKAPAPGTPRATSQPLDVTDLEAKRLDCLIQRIRDGRVNDVVMRHLEVDGVLQLDPLFEVGGCEEPEH